MRHPAGLTQTCVANQRARIVQSPGDNSSLSALDVTDFVGRNLLRKGAKGKTKHSYNGSERAEITNKKASVYE